MGAADSFLGGSNTAAAGPVALPVVEPGRGSSQATHLSLALSLLTMQVPHVHELVAFTGGFIPAAFQLKVSGAADLVPEVNENTGREDGSVAAAALRSLPCFDVVWESAGTSKENDGRDAESRASAASFASLGTDFAGRDSELELATGGLATSKLGVGVGRLEMVGG